MAMVLANWKHGIISGGLGVAVQLRRTAKGLHQRKHVVTNAHGLHGRGRGADERHHLP